MTACPIRVLVVDDHLVVRRGLATLLLAFTDLLLVGEAQSGAEALELCATVRPNVILMDLMMPELDGAEATRAIRERYPTIQVIALITFDEYALVQRALAAGARGILPKCITNEELATNIRRVHTGRPSLAPRSIEAIVHNTPIPTLPLPTHSEELTEREGEVLGLMIHGLTNAQIGEELIVSRATAKAHVSSILGKLGVTTRTEAVALAVQSHLTSASV
jgi:NarL family two-component system response regulator LiaR